jgi:hypothetical protein
MDLKNGIEKMQVLELAASTGPRLRTALAVLG